jgi:predicted dienelactone hydrolase
MNMPWSASCDTHPTAVTQVSIPDGTSRDLSLTVRYPSDGKAKAIVVFCHGLGSSGAAYGGLTQLWVEQGYLVIHPTFADSIFEVAGANPDLGLDPADESLTLWAKKHPEARKKMFQILHDPDHWKDRIRIVQQVLANLPVILSATGTQTHDLPMAIAGHSFGAYTAQLLAGVEVDFPEGPKNFRDDRFTAALVLSGQGRDQQGLRNGSWNQMTGPALTVTGQQDGGAKGQDWRWKCEPYELAPPGGKVLAVLDDANHYLGGMTPEGDTVPYQFAALSLVTTAFLEAYVGQRQCARNWLSLIEDRIANCPVIFRQK